jgi:hypothetical protein
MSNSTLIEAGDRSARDKITRTVLPGSRTVPCTAQLPPERSCRTSHEAMNPPAPVTHTLVVFAAPAGSMASRSSPLP